MPELPEVETTRRGLATIIPGNTVHRFKVYNANLRWPIPQDLPQIIQGQPLVSCTRRAKYLLFNFPHGSQIIHLGMSGSIRRVDENSALLKHDHAEWRLGDITLRYHDPRRFGAILWHDSHMAADINQHALLRHLGPEPFDSRLTGTWLHQQLVNKRQAIKQSLLDSRLIVGIGNIYASEALFRAAIHPKTPASRLSVQRCERLLQAIQTTLHAAIEAGGTTLKDYQGANGEAGAYFELHAQVYGKENAPCPHCSRPIKRIVQGQRASYYCAHCQHY